MGNGNAREIQVIVFDLGNTAYAAEILDIREIIRVPRITLIPGTENYCESVFDLRGEVVPVIDLRKALGLPVSELSKASRVLVAPVDEQLHGFIVDAVKEVIKVQVSMIQPPPRVVVTKAQGGGIRGVIRLEDRLLILLNLEAIAHSIRKQGDLPGGKVGDNLGEHHQVS